MPTKVVLSPRRVFPSLLESRCFVCTGFDWSMKYLPMCIHPPAGAARPGTARQGETLSGWSALPGSASACIPAAAVGQSMLALLLRDAALGSGDALGSSGVP